MRTTLWAIVLAAASLLPGTAGADEMIMKNGSRLIGRVVSAGEGKIEFDTEFAGTLSIDSEAVDTLFTDHEVTLMMQDGRVIENQRIATRDNAMIMMSDTTEAVLFDTKDMKRLNPEPWELGRGYQWVGNVATAMLVERGNTDTNELDISGESTWRSLKDRYSIRAYYELDENDGVKNKNKWRWRNSYDRFSATDSDQYYGMLLAFEADEFIDLDLRTYVGPYIGRQFFERRYLSLKGEVGLVWVDERLNPDPAVDPEGIELPDQNDYPGANWSLRFTSDFIGESTDFYIDHDGIVNFEEPDALLLNTTIGLKFTVYGGFEVGVEARFEYDGGVTSEVEELDKTYNVKLGYEW